MCSISGAVITNRSERAVVEYVLNGIIEKAKERGRDSFGSVILNSQHGIGYKGSFVDHTVQIDKHTCIVINNNRAEPTTEWVKNKTLDDVQPFVLSDQKTGRTVAVPHNRRRQNRLAPLDYPFNAMRS